MRPALTSSLGTVAVVVTVGGAADGPAVPTDQFSVKKRRIRRRSATPKEDKDLYFNSGTQAAIVEYQQLLDPIQKNAVYVARIHPAFVKLVENLINIHKFSSLHDTQDILLSDCVVFLYESIRKFDPTRGTNAFSYFNIVAKHWLIIRSKQKATRLKKGVSLSDRDALSKVDAQAIDDYSVVESQDETLFRSELTSRIVVVMREIRTKLKTPNELACIDAIASLFERADEIDIVNKSAALLYIREMSGLTPKQLTLSLYNVKKLYKELRGDDDLGIF